MAKEKNAAVVEQPENAVVEQPENAVVEQPENFVFESSELVEVFIPRSDANKDPNFFVAVNGKTYILPRGKASKVPFAVAAEIRRAQAAEDAMYEAKAKLKEAAGLPGEG